MLLKLKEWTGVVFSAYDRRRALTYRFFKYGCVQIVAYGVDLGAFMLGTQLLQAPPIVGNVAGKICSGVFAFFVHRHFTFQPSGRGLANEARRYFMLALLNMSLSSVLLYIFNFFMPDVAAKIAGDVVCVGLTFLLVQKIVFPAPVDRPQKN